MVRIHSRGCVGRVSIYSTGMTRQPSQVDYYMDVLDSLMAVT